MTATVTDSYFNAYVLENRQYIGYDDSLSRARTTSGSPSDPNRVEHFRYQNGLLISYWDESFGDNNVGDHPGGGLILPVDSHPVIMKWKDGSQVRPRINAYDSTFTIQRTDADHASQPGRRGREDVQVTRRRARLR